MLSPYEASSVTRRIANVTTAMIPRVLLTGPPGSGKTTAVRRVVDLLSGLRMAGFYTEEIRGRSGRTGFRVVTLDGRTAPLATLQDRGGPRVGRYSVHLDEFEAVALSQLDSSQGVDLIVVDEIGKMECHSPAFVALARRVLTAPMPFLGTVALSGSGFVAEAKSVSGVTVIAISRENRDRLPAEIADRFRRVQAQH
jgi:nucleoside-triphosphatase